MTFATGDKVISDRVQGRVGTVVRVRKLRRLYLVTWSKNISFWLDGQDLQPAPATAEGREPGQRRAMECK